MKRYPPTFPEKLNSSAPVEIVNCVNMSSSTEGDCHGDDGHRSIGSDFSTSAVRIDIADFTDLTNSFNLTTNALKKCKVYVLKPYSRLLKVIGWKPIGKDTYRRNKCLKVLNVVYVLLILLLVLYTYVYDILVCQWKLDVKRDTQFEPTTTLMPSTTHSRNNSNSRNTSSVEMIVINGSTVIEIFPPPPDVLLPTHENQSRTCDHIITTYIIPDVLHITAYILGLIYFRVRENEQLYALMEKVFLQTTIMNTRSISQTKLLSRLKIFQVVGTCWVLLTICVQGLFVYTFGVESQNMLHDLHPAQEADGSYSTSTLTLLWSLFAIDLLGVAFVNCINLAVVLNYSTQCEMLIYYIRSISARLKERSAQLRSSMKDVLGVRESISLLNSSMAQMTSLAVIRFGHLCVIGLCILILNKDDHWKVWLFRSLFPLVWGLVLATPLIQAARLNAACSKFKTISLNVRVFGYQNSSLEDLDSFLLFISNTTLRAKLFHISMKPSYLLGSIILICFILLLLFQSSFVGPAGRIF